MKLLTTSSQIHKKCVSEKAERIYLSQKKHFLPLFFKIFIIVYCPNSPGSLPPVHRTIFSVWISFLGLKEKKEKKIQFKDWGIRLFAQLITVSKRFKNNIFKHWIENSACKYFSSHCYLIMIIEKLARLITWKRLVSLIITTATSRVPTSWLAKTFNDIEL